MVFRWSRHRRRSISGANRSIRHCRRSGRSAEMKTALVTGCDHGLGVEVAKACLTRGDRVIAVCFRSRSAGEIRKLRKEHGDRLTVLAADLSSEEHLKRMCGIVRKKTK